MSEQHTPGRLKNVKHSIYSDAGYSIALSLLTRSSLGEEHDEANARRLVACWNRLEKFTTEHIEDDGYDLFADVRPDFERVMRQRDKLLAALKHIASHGNKMDFDAVAYARAAIAKAEGGAA